MDMSRFRNYGLWVSIAALIPMILKVFGVDVIPEDYENIVQTILSILVMAGILNNPTTKTKGFKDDKNMELNEEEKN